MTEEQIKEKEALERKKIYKILRRRRLIRRVKRFFIKRKLIKTLLILAKEYRMRRYKIKKPKLYTKFIFRNTHRRSRVLLFRQKRVLYYNKARRAYPKIHICSSIYKTFYRSSTFAKIHRRNLLANKTKTFQKVQTHKRRKVHLFYTKTLRYFKQIFARIKRKIQLKFYKISKTRRYPLKELKILYNLTKRKQNANTFIRLFNIARLKKTKKFIKAFFKNNKARYVRRVITRHRHHKNQLKVSLLKKFRWIKRLYFIKKFNKKYKLLRLKKYHKKFHSDLFSKKTSRRRKKKRVLRNKKRVFIPFPTRAIATNRFKRLKNFYTPYLLSFFLTPQRIIRIRGEMFSSGERKLLVIKAKQKLLGDRRLRRGYLVKRYIKRLRKSFPLRLYSRIRRKYPKKKKVFLSSLFGLTKKQSLFYNNVPLPFLNRRYKLRRKQWKRIKKLKPQSLISYYYYYNRIRRKRPFTRRAIPFFQIFRFSEVTRFTKRRGPILKKRPFVAKKQRIKLSNLIFDLK